MQTRSYASLLLLIQSLCGVDEFALNEIGRIKALINRRALRAYRMTNYWPRFFKLGEERRLSSSEVLPATTTVDGEAYFIETIGNTDFTAIGADSNTVGTYFVATGTGSGTGMVRVALGYLPYEQEALPSIDTFLRIHKSAPYVSASAVEYDFVLDYNGATLICGNLNPATAFVTYKAQFTDTYGDGDGETADIPAEWFQYLAHGTYADYLRAEGQQEKAMAAEAEAEVLLQDELIRIDQQHQHQVVGSRIFTNANMQTRY